MNCLEAISCILSVIQEQGVLLRWSCNTVATLLIAISHYRLDVRGAFIAQFLWLLLMLQGTIF
jgi:hypothetical protein